MITSALKVIKKDTKNHSLPSIQHGNAAMVALSSPSQPHRRRQSRLLFILLIATFVVYRNITTIYAPHTVEKVSFTKQIKLSFISLLRSTLFPLLRHPIQCISPTIQPANVSIDLASIYYRDKWTADLQEMYQLSERNKLEFVRTNEYVSTLYNGTQWANENIDHLSVKSTWFKPLFLEGLVKNLTAVKHPRPDWILYLDHDIIILNHDFDLRELITLSEGNVHENVAMILSTDAEGINTGAFIIRVNEFGVKIMESWMEGRDSGMDDQSYFWTMFDDDGYLKKGMTKSQDATTIDQSIIPRMKLVRPCSLNSGGGIERKRGSYWLYFEGVYCKGDFAVHFFGRPDKLVQMKDAYRGSLGFISR